MRRDVVVLFLLILYGGPGLCFIVLLHKTTFDKKSSLRETIPCMTEGAQTVFGLSARNQKPKINFKEGFAANPIHISSRVSATVVNPSSLNEWVLCGNLKRGWLEENGLCINWSVECPNSLTHPEREREWKRQVIKSVCEGERERERESKRDEENLKQNIWSSWLALI